MTVVEESPTTLGRFWVEYQNYRGITERRGREQRQAVEELAAHAGVDDAIECTPEQYRAWLLHLTDGLSGSTVKKKGMQVRAFFGWAFDAGLYTGEDLMAIRRADFPATPRRLPRPYKPKEIKRLWPAIAKHFPLDSGGKWRKRYFRGTSRFTRIEAHANHLQITAMTRIAVECGLRRQEIFDLDLEDMHYDNAYIVVREGKGGKFREVPYTKRAREAVKAWIEFRTELSPGHDRPWLALTTSGGALLKPMRFPRFEVYLLDVGDWQWHRLRHTCATTWLRAGMDIEVLSKLLGHANIQETMGYVELVRRDVQKQVERHEEEFGEDIG
jgi:site-specific recombinase XerD